ncbi:MAG: hypothetical protein HKN19_19250 [Halioglobus sp.]|nr:hypothetical protein [Halioglobus sp.]
MSRVLQLIRPLIASALFGASFDASALLITFDSLESPGSGATTMVNPLDLGDFRFETDGGFSSPVMVSYQQGSSRYNGSAALTGSNSSDLKMTRIDGAIFGVTSVDLDDLSELSPGIDFSFELMGTLAGGGTVTQLFTGDSVLGNQSVSLLPAFSQISSLHFGGTGRFNFSNVGTVDNIRVVSSSVSVPGVPSLFVLGLVALLSAKRQRHKTDAHRHTMKPQ